MDKKEKIDYLKSKINKIYKTKSNLKKNMDNRNYDKTILEKLEQLNG